MEQDKEMCYCTCFKLRPTGLNFCYTCTLLSRNIHQSLSYMPLYLQEKSGATRGWLLRAAVHAHVGGGGTLGKEVNVQSAKAIARPV